MMQQASQYHVFSIPSSLLTSLTPREHISQTPPRVSSPAPTAALGARACNVCLASGFGDVDEQRAHFRSDWHRYNVKMRLNGASPVTESAFAELMDRTRPMSIWLVD
jgi:hypothetical protein